MAFATVDSQVIKASLLSPLARQILEDIIAEYHALAATLDEDLTTLEGDVTTLYETVFGDGEEAVGLVDNVAALDETVNGDGAEEVGLVATFEDHASRIDALENPPE